MKHNYIKPETIVVEMIVETMLAMSDHIPMENTPGTPAANERRGEWSDPWI